MMRVAITGATGFLGAAVTRRLAQDGAAIDVLIRPNSDTSHLSDLPITYFTGDITQPDSLHEFCAAADCIVHAAGQLGKPLLPPEAYTHINVDGARNVFAAALARPNPPKVVHLSSGGVLPPLKPPYDLGGLVEATPYGPVTAYDKSKVSAEKVAHEFIAKGLPMVVVRPEFIYGPGDRHVLGIFKAIQRGIFFYVGSGQNTCHPTYIDDCTDGIVACLTSGRLGETYQIAGPRPVSFVEFAEAISAELGVRPPWLKLPRSVAYAGASLLEVAQSVTGKPMPLTRNGVSFFSEWRGSSTVKAQREVGFEPQVELAEGVRRSVAWYCQNNLL